MRIDPHSYADDTQPTVHDLDWKASVDFEKHVITARASLRFSERTKTNGPLDLDTRGLALHKVSDFEGKALKFELGAIEEVFGQKLRIEIPAGCEGVVIDYETSPNSSALQWLTPAQTAGGKHPFLFSQCQAIHARSLIPIQDTPRNRISYRAELTVPCELRALMAAGFVSREEQGKVATECYEMHQPIPPYLFALAVGDLVSRDLAPRSRVWSEPTWIDRSAYEFAEVDQMLTAAEHLFGPYDWERFDFLVLPPSFPYGGMENPRLTFLTPTLLAGDRSLVDVLAHELAHSWAGNLITNATAEHFWLNEGLTVYAERRIVEALHGKDVAAISAANGMKSLEEAIEHFKDRPQLTCLHTHLDGVDPDDAYSIVPYEKGYLLFLAMENELGRETFDRFLKKYLAHFRFKSITTEEFVEFTRREAPGVLEKVHADQYLDGTGIPKSAILPRSQRLDAIATLGEKLPAASQVKNWTAAEWQFWLGHLSKLTLDRCREIDSHFQLSKSGNYEILVSWLEKAVPAGYSVALDRAEQVLGQVGRMKYLKPLYRAFAEQDSKRAKAIFDKNREGYHPIAVRAIAAIVSK
jgi:leukotriene-A4 hydrolase